MLLQDTPSRSAKSPFPTVATAITLLVSGTVLLGWLLDIASFRTFFVGQVSMKANTAAGFLICAVLLGLAGSARPFGGRILRGALEISLLALGLATLTQYVAGIDLNLDQLFVAAPPGEPMTVSPGRMAPTTAIGFVLLACSFVLDHWQRPRARTASRAFATIALVIALTSVTGYAYGEPALYLGIQGLTAMALPTAVLFTLVALGIVWLHPESGIPALLNETSLISSHIRSLLIMVICAPLLVGAVVSAGYGRFYEGEVAVVMTSLGSVLVAAAVAFVSVVVLRRAESALYVKDRALAAATNGVVITDHRGRDEPIIFVNEAFTQITGYSAPECVGKNCRFLNQDVENPPGILDNLREIIASARRGTVEFRNRRKNGEIFWNRLSLAPIENHEGTVTHLVGVIDDVTEVRDQGSRLRRALDDARTANAMRDTFIHVISHELRTPLNAALTWLRLMELDDSPETRKKGLAVMLQSIDSQSRLIDDLVDITRIAATGITLESKKVDARELITTSVEELRPGIEQDHELVTSIEPGDYSANLDPVRLQQIVRNLLSNAAKYTQPGGRIEIGVRVEDGLLQLTVRDTGKGLTAEEIERIFEPFWRADSNITGLGVGLSIVAALVEAHDGTIEVTSQGPNTGSTFSIRVPMDASPSGHAALRDAGGTERAEEETLSPAP